MAGNDKDKLISAAAAVAVPGLGMSLGETGAAIEVDDGDPAKPRIGIRLGFPAAGIAVDLARKVQDELRSQAGIDNARVEVDWVIRSHAVQGTLAPRQGVKNIIAIASGKGGVGKSTTAINLALALAAEGASVGVLDGDIYGPSQPTMLGLEGERPVSNDGKNFEPLEMFGLQAISIGFLVDRDQAMIWRGPMVTQALQQMMFQTAWRDLDYLIVDLPPGTGDAQLTLTQKIPVSGAVIVTTPQDISLMDARRGLLMFEKVGVTVLGIIENMSVYICPACGHEAHVFGQGGGQSLAGERDVTLLGELPLDIRIRREADSGRPTVAADPESEIAMRYREVARAMAARLAMQPVDRKGLFGSIVVENA